MKGGGKGELRRKDRREAVREFRRDVFFFSFSSFTTLAHEVRG